MYELQKWVNIAADRQSLNEFTLHYIHFFVDRDRQDCVLPVLMFSEYGKLFLRG